MIIGIDGSRLGVKSSGIGRYLLGLLPALDRLMPEAEFILYTKRNTSLHLPSERWTVKSDPNQFCQKLPNVFWTRFRLGMLAAQDQIEVFWAANTLTPLHLGNIPIVTTVYDLNHLLVPQSMSFINRHAHRQWLANDIRNSCVVVAISNGTSLRMLRSLGRQADYVAKPGIPLADISLTTTEAEIELDNLGITKPYLLAVGTREPRKNLAATIAAVSLLKQSNHAFVKHRLVLAGAKGWGNDPLRKTAPEWILPLGYVSDRQLVALYKHAEVFIFPSLYEGFGIPVSEALLFGCPVVTTDIPELHEAGNHTVIYIATTPEAIAEGINQAISRIRPIPHRPTYNWMSSALQMRDAFKQAALCKTQQ